ncbi:M56 family metallopeptidase [Pedobacter sp. Leaf132]|uniref:M56 family metallopeptidase n=1 Tax=Pedobacter sp. Leaf132 TaxID=2876557 RepID=UPI001E59C826|nr:M56 family metallopeptidase [Pedobacter sp. Leaf132]
METLLPQFIKAFGWSILNSLWQSALIYGILFIVLLSLPKLAAKYRHNLAFGSILLMFGFFIYNLTSILLKNIAIQKASGNVENLNTHQYLNTIPENLTSKIEQYFPVVVVFYIIGIALQLFVIIKGYNKLARFKKEKLSLVPDAWNDIFQKVTSNLKINKTIKFHLSSIVNVPLVIGYLKPIVLFPVALVNELDSDQVEAILIHELSHIRRNDFLLNLIKTAIETFLFFNPFVWMAGRFIHIEREHACDDLVLKLTGKPLNYAHALLKLELLKDKNSPAYALAATGKTQNLYQRIKRITNMKTNYLNAKQQMAALTLGIACLVSVAWINPAKKEIKKTTKKIELLSVANISKNAMVFIDTTKKHKIKIVTIDASGKKTEYNSLKEVPDSLRRDLYDDELFGGRKAFVIGSDSAFRFRDSIFKEKIYREFGLARLKSKSFGEDVKLAKEFSSPEAQAKWKKFGEDIGREYGSPAAQEKWRKLSAEALASVNFDALKISLDSTAKISLTEYMSLALKELKSPEWKTELDELHRFNGNKNFDKKQKELSINFQKKFNAKHGFPYTSTTPLKISIDKNDKIIESAEYKKLKQKFDTEVKELREKMEKQEKPERRENEEN